METNAENWAWEWAHRAATVCSLGTALVTVASVVATGSLAWLWVQFWAWPFLWRAAAAVGVGAIAGTIVGTMAGEAAFQLRTRRVRLPAIAGRKFFVDRWLRPDGEVLDLADDGSARSRLQHGPVSRRGTWEYLEGEARIAWDASPAKTREILKPDGLNARVAPLFFSSRPSDRHWQALRRVSQECPDQDQQELRKLPQNQHGQSQEHCA